MERVAWVGDTVRSLWVFDDEGMFVCAVWWLTVEMDPRMKLITEINLLLQETLYLKQIGVIPYGRQ
jgi:hypothetical protein